MLRRRDAVRHVVIRTKRWMVLALVLCGVVPVTAQADLRLEGITVTPHIQSANMRYRRPPDPQLGARVECFLRNDGPATVEFDAQSAIRFDGMTPAELLENNQWSWHDTPPARSATGLRLPSGAMTVWSFNGQSSDWGAGTNHQLQLPDGQPMTLPLAAPGVWISAVTFLAPAESLLPNRVVVHLQNQTAGPLQVSACRLWLPTDREQFLAFHPGPLQQPSETFPASGELPTGEKSVMVLQTDPLPLGYAVVEVQLLGADGQSRSLWSMPRVKAERFDISGGWVSSDVNGRSTLTMEPYLKTLKRMHINTGQIQDVAGYTDNEDLYRRYPIKLFNRLQPLERYDTPEMLGRIHAVEFLGEPQYGGGRPVPPQEVWQAFEPYQASRLHTTVTHSEERVWRYYAGLSDYPHFDAYRVTAPAADAWWLYDRWGQQRIRWGAPLETIGDLTRSLRDLNRPRPIAAWSQGAHDGWRGRIDGRRRRSPTPEELRAQAYHALAQRVTSLYWFNLSLKSLLQFPDLIDPITRVDREIRLIDDLLLSGDAYQYQRISSDQQPDWDLASVAGPDGGLFFALDLQYQPDSEQRVFRFERRDASPRFRLPTYLRQPAEVFRLDADGVHDVQYQVSGDMLELHDTVYVVGIYVASQRPGLRAKLQQEHAALLALEASYEFDPAGNEADLQQLQQLLEPSAPAEAAPARNAALRTQAATTQEVVAATPADSSLVARLPNSLRPPFRWQASAPLLQAPVGATDEYYSLKDPSIVFDHGRWHLFCTVRGRDRSHQIEYLSFADFDHAPQAQRQFLAIHPGFYCAPQVFYFRPRQTWYLICQASDPAWQPEYGPAFSTTKDIADAASWSPLMPLGYRKPADKAGLDFWIICDDSKAHLFFTTLDGRMWREETRLADFPAGWSEPVVALQADVFEASHTYTLQGLDLYLTVIEAQHPQGGRYYKAYVADRLDGEWQPLADQEANSFADRTNVSFPGEPWSDSISHGELLRAGIDQRVEIDPARLQFLFQGVTQQQRAGKVYGQFPWRLGLLTPVAARSSAPRVIQHVAVYDEPGRFGGWPANHGIWSWGNEILVGFSAGYYQDLGPERHAIDHNRPEEHLLARSLDGGGTWTIENPAAQGVLLGTAGMRHGTLPPGYHEPEPVDCPGGIRFTHPDFAMTVRIGPTDLLCLRRRREGEGEPKRRWIDAFLSHDDGQHWEYLSDPVPELGEGNPPCLTKLVDGRLCLTYGYRAEPFSILARFSRDQGQTWSEPFVLRDDGSSRDLGYPRTVQRPDGKLVTVYYFHRRGETDRKILATIWDPGSSSLE